MERSGSTQQLATTPDETPPSPPGAGDVPHAPPPARQIPGGPRQGGARSVFVFNPFAEAYMARGQGFTPVLHQTKLAEDLANLPQFLCQPGDVVLAPKRPPTGFLKLLEQAGFPPPEFIELKDGRIDPADSLSLNKLGSLRPWAWGPDSVRLFQGLFAQVAGKRRPASEYFSNAIARLYSKAWSADFLRTLLAHGRPESWLCSEQEAGVAVDTLEEALGAIAAIRGRGHHRVVVKEAHGLAGHNAIRLWEPEILPAQQHWLMRALGNGRQLVVEPWLERELDFSIQLEMEPGGLRLWGYTGLINDGKGQFLANWAEPEYSRCLPARVASLLQAHADISKHLERLYGEVFSSLEAELQRVGFVGPVSVDALVYRTRQGDCRLKPVVEMNPRYTMGRLTLELMKHACPGTCGVFRLVSRAQARREGFADLSAYACSLSKRFPLLLEGKPAPRIRQGALCLTDPDQAQVCLAVFEVTPTLAACLKNQEGCCFRGRIAGTRAQPSACPFFGAQASACRLPSELGAPAQRSTTRTGAQRPFVRHYTHMQKLVVILGTNASGKSELGIRLARHFGGEIVSADSRQVYRGLDLGSGKITPAQAAAVKHHLIDVVDVSDYYSLAQYQRAAYSAIDSIGRAGKLPFLVGGTGLYISAIVEGYQLVDVPPNDELRAELEALPLAQLVARLEEADPDAARRIDKSNPRRLVRAIEIASAGYANCAARQNLPRYDALQLGLTWPREILAQRIDERLRERLANGMIDEVAALRSRGVSDLRLDKLGLEYRDIARFLRGELGSVDDLRAHLGIAIRQFAKEQLTWFRRDKRIIWLDPFKDCFQEACQHIRDWEETKVAKAEDFAHE